MFIDIAPYSGQLGGYAPYAGDLVYVITSLVAAILAADLSIAFGHWAMDRYGSDTCRIEFARRVFVANRSHHAWPTRLLQNSLIANASETLVIGVVILVLAWMLGMLTWQVWVFASAVGISAIYHRWHHEPKDRINFVVRIAQKVGLLQDRRQHSEHHRAHDINYSVLTNLANYILEATKAFRKIECLIERCFGIRPFDLEGISNESRKAKKD